VRRWLCECPGSGLHTTHNGKRDCKVYLGGVPTLTCFHASCKEILGRKNSELRQALRDGTVDPNARTRLTVEEKKRLAEIQRKMPRAIGVVVPHLTNDPPS
jgi:hypothetical protein